MTEDTLLNAPVRSQTGKQVLLIGLMMFAMGMIVGINLVAVPAWQSTLASIPPGVTVSPPEYLRIAGQINNGAVVAVVLSLAGLLWMDYKA